MKLSNHGLRLLSVSTIALVSAFTLPGTASAQLFFDWGGSEQKVNDTGRQPVRINADAKPGEIIVSFTDRKLYLITAPGHAISYPVAIPREQDRWEGKTTVTQKRENPSWTPTPTMLKENPRLPRWVPGGHPMNPLGNRALYLGSSYYRIHGTDAPWTIGTAVSKGCIRMYNKDALEVFEQTKIGAKVLVTWNSYQATPEEETAQPAVAHEESASVHRASASAQAPSSPRATPAASVGGEHRVAQSSSRYSDIFGTPEPKAPAARSSTQGSGETNATPQQAPAKSVKPARERDTQTQREPRKSREPSGEGERAAAPSTPPSEAAAASQSSRPKANEPKARPTSVETGSLQERKPKPKAASAPAQEQMSAAAAAQAEVAAKALEAAERAAAAAERAAAAAERAEKALATKAAASAPAVVAPSPAPNTAAPVVPTAAPAVSPTHAGGD